MIGHIKPEATREISVVLLLSALVLSATMTGASASGVQVDSVSLIIYRDGLVHFTQTLSVNETYPAITLPLLAPSVENVLVLDENQTVLDYAIYAPNLTVFTLGAERILLEYDTISLTTKAAELWTLTVDSPYNLTVFLPENSTVVYLSDMPTTIDTEGSKITLLLSPGPWEISYVLPSLPPDGSTDGEGSPIKVPIIYLIAATAAAASVLFLTLVVLRWRREPNVKKILAAHPQLKQEDENVIKFLGEKGGRVFEAEIRRRFPDMPRTSLWRLVRRLERLEIVTVRKVGLENQVELKK